MMTQMAVRPQPLLTLTIVVDVVMFVQMEQILLQVVSIVHVYKTVPLALAVVKLLVFVMLM